MNATTGIQAAIAALQGGDAARAALICDQVLRAEPRHAQVLHLSGLIACQRGRCDLGIDFFARSLASNPHQPGVYANIGGALVTLRRADEAIAFCDRALSLQPGSAEAHYSRGCALHELQRHEEAIADFDAALKASPKLVPALISRGNALCKLGHLDEALASFERALAVQPNDVMALYNRGNVLRDLLRNEDALASYDRALALNLRSAELLNNRGNVLRDLGRLREALECYEQALAMQPDITEPLNNRGTTLLDLGQTKAAIGCFQRVLQLQPHSPATLDNLGLAYRMDERPDEALTAYTELLRIAPQYKAVRMNLHHARALCCDWTQYSHEVSPLIESLRAGSPGNPFPLLAISHDAALQRQCAHDFAASEGWLKPSAPLWTGERYQHERLRIAYVSADFRQHALSFLLAGVLEQHDRQRYEVIGISLQPEDPSVFGQRVRSAFDRFVDATHLSDRETAAAIRDLEVDIAVDLMGCTRLCRPAIFAQRPAPVQVNFLGYPGSMGVPFIDYIIADDFVIPRDKAHLYAEQVVYLPECFQPNDDRRVIDPTPTRADAGLPEQGFVFCCFNNTYKFTPQVFDIWMRLLTQVPGSVLWLPVDNRVAGENLRREASQRGVDPDRLVLARRLPYAEHLGRTRLADLFLDTLPFNAGTTASDALWAGVPLLTCAGEAFASRMAGSLLRAVGLPELITYTLEDYERVALDLARDPDKLRPLRARLAANRDTSPLFNTGQYCRHLEAAYQELHAKRTRGEQPVGLALE
jgi:protein O-GlcNAc transferase